MRKPVPILLSLLAVLLAGCNRGQAPEPVSAAPPEVSTGGTPVPAMEAQRADKRGD